MSSLKFCLKDLEPILLNKLLGFVLGFNLLDRFLNLFIITQRHSPKGKTAIIAIIAIIIKTTRKIIQLGYAEIIKNRANATLAKNK